MTKNDAAALLEQWALWSRCDMQSIYYKKQSAFVIAKTSVVCSINDDMGEYIDRCISALERDYSACIYSYFLMGLSQENSARRLRIGRRKFLVRLDAALEQFIKNYLILGVEINAN
jgi:hypothetical protein